ncbi:MAG: dihydrodipicolinate synthase family protein [Pseudomonadota bacterium]|nr:dihydrodipicolinate synthase family protein [Pseudomonadota bacterium]MEE3286804.1 dihydrodipicolinate synthase family protein [Pseudomonadota bacterium]
MANTELSGVIPPMTTPFTEQGELDLSAVKTQIDWLVDCGVSGIAVGGSTGEGHTLQADEFKVLIETAMSAADGRIAVIAGIITDSTRESVRRGQMIRHSGVAALQVTPVHYVFKPEDDDTVAHFRTLTGETGMPVIIYNVIPWNYLSPELLVRVMREVPGIIGVKQSAGDMKLFADLMISAAKDDLIFSAVDGLLYASYCLGAHGSIAAILSAAPGPSVRLWQATKSGDHATALDLHERLLVLWNAIVGDALPATTKCAQILQGIPAGHPRQPMSMPSEEQQTVIRKALQGLDLA